MKYFAIKGHADTDSEAIALCANKLFTEGCVNQSFKMNCIAREKEFPTGLPSEIPVAMPHSEISGVIQNAVCMLILDEPVKFRRMDDDSQIIETQMIFNLALTGSQEHMNTLKNLMSVFYNYDQLSDLYHSKLEDLPDKLSKYLD